MISTEESLQALNEFYRPRLAVSGMSLQPLSSDDPFVWNLYSKLPGYCKRIFGFNLHDLRKVRGFWQSAVPSSSLISQVAMPCDKHTFSTLLIPRKSAFFQYVALCTDESVLFELGTESSDLPPVKLTISEYFLLNALFFLVSVNPFLLVQSQTQPFAPPLAGGASLNQGYGRSNATVSTSFDLDFSAEVLVSILSYFVPYNGDISHSLNLGLSSFFVSNLMHLLGISKNERFLAVVLGYVSKFDISIGANLSGTLATELEYLHFTAFDGLRKSLHAALYLKFSPDLWHTFVKIPFHHHQQNQSLTDHHPELLFGGGSSSMDMQRVFIGRHLLFYRMIPEYFVAVSKTLPSITSMISISTKTDKRRSLLSAKNMDDIRTLYDVLGMVYSSDNVQFLATVEDYIVNPVSSSVSSPDEEVFLTLRQLVLAELTMPYTPVFLEHGQLMDSQGLLRKLIHIHEFLDALSTKKPVKRVASSWFSFLTAGDDDYQANDETRLGAHASKSQLEIIDAVILGVKSLTGSSKAAEHWYEEARQMVAAAFGQTSLEASKEFQKPETNDANHLTIRGKGQILSGEKKCTNLDFVQKTPDLATICRNLDRVRQDEIRPLVIILVNLALFIEHILRTVVLALEKKYKIKLPKSPVDIVVVFRFFASVNNLIFTTLAYLILRIFLYLFVR